MLCYTTLCYTRLCDSGKNLVFREKYPLHHPFRSVRINASFGKLANGQAENGMHKIRRNVAQRLQHKVAEVHQRVRYGQVGLVNCLISKENDVNIDGAGLVAVATADAA